MDDYEACMRIWTALTDADIQLPAESISALRTAVCASMGADTGAAYRFLRKALEAAKGR